MDTRDPEKQRRALEVVAEAGEQAVVCPQVIKEFYNTVTTRLPTPMDPDEAERAADALAELLVVPEDGDLVTAAIRLSRRLRLSLWDAVIVQAAIAGHCERLLTEDLNDGQTIDGVRIENPFSTLT